MKSKRSGVLWLLGGLLVFSHACADTSAYRVLGVQLHELQDTLNARAKDGWILKSVVAWTTNCPNNSKECLVVVLEKK
ncbi:DUF4177 domain-containing protein [Pseudomonas sp.]|uniref:DUF4177 domain-containing protein n=1 Tax=Pseudomonas sp. TaxID=306 RepID=UPI003F3379C2